MKRKDATANPKLDITLDNVEKLFPLIQIFVSLWIFIKQGTIEFLSLIIFEDEPETSRKAAALIIIYGAFSYMIIYCIGLFRTSTNWRTESKCLYYLMIITGAGFYLSLIIMKFVLKDAGPTAQFVDSTIWISVSSPIYFFVGLETEKVTKAKLE